MKTVSDPWRGLVAAIIHRAIRDYPTKKHQQECRKFFRSEWFNELADFVEIHPDKIRKYLGMILPLDE